MIHSKRIQNNTEIICGESEYLKIEVVPVAGGKIASIFNKNLQREFLWTNTNLQLEKYKEGEDYDSHFYGGIDELMPNDIPEKIEGIEYPDHGELWTTALDYQTESGSISVSGLLFKSGIFYKKRIRMSKTGPIIYLDYSIRNEASHIRHFLWKMHAALKIEAGDRMLSSAVCAKIVDTNYSRFSNQLEFKWPLIENVDASVIPSKDKGVDFFYLYNIQDDSMSLISDRNKSIFTIHYDRNIFPYQWYFASYGGFLDHYTAILEPCTGMPLSVNEAMRLGQCAVLKPDEEINTTVSIYAGENKNH